MKQNWEENFEEEIMCKCLEEGEEGTVSNHTITDPIKIKQFISNLLLQEKQEFLKKILPEIRTDKETIPEIANNPRFIETIQQQNIGFNACRSAILENAKKEGIEIKK